MVLLIHTDSCKTKCVLKASLWGYSSAGRALAWHARGQRFDPAYLHHTRRRERISPQVMTLSSRGLGHHPFTVSTGVRIPVGSPSFVALGFVVSVKLVLQSKSFKLPGVVVQLVRIPACHAGGRGFESRPLRQKQVKTRLRARFSLVR